jgi:tetratricopeptide (TPR) repeat protein
LRMLFKIRTRPAPCLFLLACSVLSTPSLIAQEMGGDLSVGAGIFRPRNPEARRRPTGVRPRPGTRAPAGNIEERIDSALEAGNAARDARKYPTAEQAYKSIFKLKPRDPRAAYGLGNVYVDQQRWEEAEKSYRAAVASSPNNADALVALSFVLVQPRAGAGNAKRFADAENAARRAILNDPNNAAAFDRLGVALESRGIFNSSTEAAYRRAVEFDANSAVAQVHLGRLLRKMNRGNEAEPFYARAIEIAQDAPTLVLIADALQSEQRWDNSEPLLRRALGLDARNPGALLLLGRFLTVRQRYQDAEGFLKTAIQVSPRNFQNYILLGRAYLGMDRYDDASRTYDQALPFASAAERKQLAGAFGFTGVGDGFAAAGRMRDAVKAYERALLLEPANADAQKKLAAARARIGSRGE